MDRVLVSPTVSVISQIARGDAEPDVVMSDCCCCFRSHFGFLGLQSWRNVTDISTKYTYPAAQWDKNREGGEREGKQPLHLSWNSTGCNIWTLLYFHIWTFIPLSPRDNDHRVVLLLLPPSNLDPFAPKQAGIKKKKKSLSTWLYSNQQITQPREDSKQYLLDGCALPSTLHRTLSSLCSCKQLYAASNTTRITEHTLNIYSDLFCCHTACMYINQRGQHLIFTVYSNCVLLRRLGCFILLYLSFCPHRGTLSCHFS